MNDTPASYLTHNLLWDIHHAEERSGGKRLRGKGQVRLASFGEKI